MSKKLLEIKKLSRSYPDKGSGRILAVEDVDLAVNEGEFVALKGSSGCGKTTLLLTAGALLHPDKGEVIVNGQDPYRLSLSARAEFRARNIGFVFQNFHLVPYLSVFENVTLCGLATGNKDIDSQAGDLIRKFGLENRKTHLPSELSVGEQQRVALARAICGGASIILADEPTGNLDTENGKIVLEHLADFAKNGGAVLMVTHDQNAGNYAFRTLNMKDGKLNNEQ